MKNFVDYYLVPFVENILFASRWFLVLLYIGLTLGLGIYCFKFSEELISMMWNFSTITTETAMLGILGLVDITMVANLIIMVTIGGYSIFIREIDPNAVNNRPRFMSNITAGGLKTKLATSLIGVSSIHLLKKFIESASESGTHHLNWYTLGMLLAIHFIFIVSAIALALIDYIPHSHVSNKETPHA